MRAPQLFIITLALVLPPISCSPATTTVARSALEVLTATTGRPHRGPLLAPITCTSIARSSFRPLTTIAGTDSQLGAYSRVLVARQLTSTDSNVSTTLNISSAGALTSGDTYTEARMQCSNTYGAWWTSDTATHGSSPPPATGRDAIYNVNGNLVMDDYVYRRTGIYIRCIAK